MVTAYVLNSELRGSRGFCKDILRPRQPVIVEYTCFHGDFAQTVGYFYEMDVCRVARTKSRAGSLVLADTGE